MHLGVLVQGSFPPHLLSFIAPRVILCEYVWKVVSLEPPKIATVNLTGLVSSVAHKLKVIYFGQSTE